MLLHVEGSLPLFYEPQGQWSQNLKVGIRIKLKILFVLFNVFEITKFIPCELFECSNLIRSIKLKNLLLVEMQILT